VSFAAGLWSVETVENEPDDFAAIGRAIATHGDLRLWCCHTGAGVPGGRFAARLARATGVGVATASGLVGATARGGCWNAACGREAPDARAPLSARGLATYSGILALKFWTGPGSVINPADGNWNTDANWFPSGVPAANDDVVLGGTISARAYTVTLDADSAPLDSVTINSAGIGPTTLAVGAFTLDVTGSGIGAPDNRRRTGRREPREPRERRARPGQPERRVRQVQPGTRGQRERRVRPAHGGRRDPPVQLAPLGRPARPAQVPVRQA
jgi:hypothetical protein